MNKRKIAFMMALVMTMSLTTNIPKVFADSVVGDAVVSSTGYQTSNNIPGTINESWSTTVNVLIIKDQGKPTAFKDGAVSGTAKIESSQVLNADNTVDKNAKVPDATLSAQSWAISDFDKPVSIAIGGIAPNGQNWVGKTLVYNIAFETTSSNLDTKKSIITVYVKLNAPAADTTKPTVSASGAASGWTNNNVSVNITANDNKNLASISYQIISSSGVTAPEVKTNVSGTTASIPVTFSDEGQYTVYYWATDVSGNTSDKSSFSISIDKTKPSITGAATTAANAGGWYNNDVTVHFTGSDNVDGSGIKSVTPDVILGEGKGQSVSGTATDNAGNSNSTTVSGINVDKTNPTISQTSVEGTAGANGWYKSAVTVSYNYIDALSGIDSTSTSANNVTLDHEGSNLSAKVHAVDLAGNSAEQSTAAYNIDWTAPSTSAILSGTAAPSTGWYKSNVQVTLTNSDNASGVDYTEYSVDGGVSWTRYSGPFTVERTSTFDYRSIDKAGNVEGLKSKKVNIDTTSAVVSHTLTTEGANYDVNGTTWYNNDVTATFTVSDDESGVVGTINPFTFKEGKNQSTNVTVVNGAGLSTTYTVSGINIDKSAPTTTISYGTPNGSNGWFVDSNIQVSLAANDNLSGVGNTYYKINNGGYRLYNGAFTLSDEGVYTISYYSVDNVGNIENSKSVTINLEKDGPVVTYKTVDNEGNEISANEDGWFNQDVTVQFNATNTKSGGVNQPALVVLSSEGRGFQATGTATDNAGKTGTVTASGINIDKTKPVIDLSVIDGKEFKLNEVVKAGWSVTDSLSGIKSAVGTVGSDQNIDTSSVGTKSFTVEAKDKAGNIVSKTVSYKVTYNYSNILQPINMDGSSVFKAGSTIPVKITVSDASGMPGSVTASDVASITFTKLGLNLSAIVNEALATDAASIGTYLRYDNVGRQYIYNLSTKGLQSGVQYAIKVTLKDGNSKTAIVTLK